MGQKKKIDDLEGIFLPMHSLTGCVLISEGDLKTYLGLMAIR